MEVVMAKKMNRCLISLSVILMALSFAVAKEIHPGLKNAIDNGDYKMAKNLVEKVGVKDIYCPASLNVDDAEKIYAARDTFQIGWCFRGARGCNVVHLIDSSFFDRYMEKHCTSSAFVSKKICADWVEYGDSNKVYDSFYKWFEEGKGVCQNVETMDFCEWLVRNTEAEYRMKFFRQLENKNLLKYRTDVEFDTTVVEVIPKKECLDNIRENSAILRMSVGAMQGISGMFNFAFGSCYFDGSKKAVKKCLNKLDAFVKEAKKECKKGTLTREVEKRLKRKKFVIPLKDEMRSVWYEMRKSKWYQMNDEWWNDYNLLSKYLEEYSDLDDVGSIRSSYSADGDLDITHLVRSCKIDPGIDKKVQKEFKVDLFSCKEILEKYPAYLGRKCDTENSSLIMKATSSLYGKDSSLILVCDKKEGVYRLPDSTELTVGQICEDPTESWIDSTREFVCDKKLGKFRYANDAEQRAGLCENPTKSWIDSTREFVCDKKLGKFRDANNLEKESGLICEDPTESWIDPSRKVVCDKKTGEFRDANYVEQRAGLCENPTKSWIDSTRKFVCDKKLGKFRDANYVEELAGLCDARNQKKEYQFWTCLGDSWHLTKEVNTKDLKFEKGKVVKGKVNPKYLYFKDFRDNEIYRAVKIGNQIWMAENMNYATIASFCLDCNVVGLLYYRDEAKTVCPSGWHLPDSTEWETLFKSVNGSLSALQARDLKKWPNGTDAYGFSLLPAPGRGTPGFWINRSHFWTNRFYYVEFDVDDYRIWEEDRGKYFVRCIKDE